MPYCQGVLPESCWARKKRRGGQRARSPRRIDRLNPVLDGYMPLLITCRYEYMKEVLPGWLVG